MNVTASDWLINLEENPDDLQLRQQFDDWLAKDEDNRRDWQETLETWRLLGMTIPAYPDLLAKTGDIPLGEGGKGEGHKRDYSGESVTPMNNAANDNKPSWGKVVMMSCAALCLAFITHYFSALDYFNADHITLDGEIREVKLADGSIVNLAPNSAITVDLTKTARHIELLSGTAYFDVEPDKDRPFTVKSDDVTTTVLGTAFNVDISQDKPYVSVSHGHVNVAHDTGEVFDLKSGDAVIFNAAGKGKKEKIGLENIAAWRHGRLFARNEDADKVISKLDRYYTGLIVVQSNKLQNKRLTGVYNLSDPVAALSVIAETYNTKLHQISPWLVVLTD